MYNFFPIIHTYKHPSSSSLFKSWVWWKKGFFPFSLRRNDRSLNARKKSIIVVLRARICIWPKMRTEHIYTRMNVCVRAVVRSRVCVCVCARAGYITWVSLPIRVHTYMSIWSVWSTYTTCFLFYQSIHFNKVRSFSDLFFLHCIRKFYFGSITVIKIRYKWNAYK